MLARGEGISMNKSLAVHYYKLSADQGFAAAQYNYGFMLARGEGISMNKSLAVHYFKLSADQSFAEAQCYYGFMLASGEGISMNKSLAAHYYKLSADQGFAEAQYNYGFMLASGEGISMNKSLAVHYYKLSADQGFAEAQYNYGFMLASGEGILMNKSLAVHYLKLAADQSHADAQVLLANCLFQGFGVAQNVGDGMKYLRSAADGGLITAQLSLGNLLRQDHFPQRDLRLSAHYFKLAADANSIEGQLRYADSLLRGDRTPENVHECERYFRCAASQGSQEAQMKLGICLISGVFGRFELNEARTFFDLASPQSEFAANVRDALSNNEEELITPLELSNKGNIFSFLRYSSIESGETIELIRLLNPHLQDSVHEVEDNFSVWQGIARLSFEYLFDLSERELHILHSLPTDLLSHNSISAMISLILRMYTAESSLYKNVNHFLRSFPISIVGKFVRELKPLLFYIYLLQSSIEYCSLEHPLKSHMVVYRGIDCGASNLVPLYLSMRGDIIVWPGFTSTSTDQDLVKTQFIKNHDSILFEISLPADAQAVCLNDDSEHSSESEVLIAASTGFLVEDIDDIDIELPNGDNITIPLVKLTYCLSWHDFDLDARPSSVIVEIPTIDWQ
jgi:TPR repeat protein